jgi:hypothetical protein
MIIFLFHSIIYFSSFSLAQHEFGITRDGSWPSLLQSTYAMRHKELITVTEQNSCRVADNRSASDEFSYLQWNPAVRYSIVSSPPLFHIISQLSPLHILQDYFLCINPFL